MKGDRPTADPGWRHEHTPTGEQRSCAGPGCKASWPVTCHNHTRKYCDSCSAGKARERNRVGKQVRRRDRKEAASDFLSFYGVTLETAAEARKQMSNRDYSSWKEELAVEKFWDDCGWEEDA